MAIVGTIITSFFSFRFAGFETEQHHVIAMEYISGGEFFDYVQQRQGLPENEAKGLFQQVVEAVQHCHEVRQLLI